MLALQDKVVIVSGASSGIGMAAARLFAKQGGQLVITARRQAELDQLAAEINESGAGRAMALAGDMTDEDFCRELVAFAVGQYGGLDVAFNNAGTMQWLGDTTEFALSSWEQTLSVNLTSAFLAVKYQIPAMLERGAGSVIFTSSFVGYTAGFPQTAAYSASKAGLIGLTQSLATEYGSKGIRVNALLPGATDTPMYRQFATTPETMAFIEGLYALKRIARPDEIAQAALFLASDAGSFTTGSAMLVDGGVSINRT